MNQELIGFKFLPASEDEDVRHGIDCWLVSRAGFRMAAQVKLSRFGRGSSVRILGGYSSREQSVSVRKALEYMRLLGEKARLLLVRVNVRGHGARGFEDLTRRLRRVLFS